jgi:hypothetical protein
MPYGTGVTLNDLYGNKIFSMRIHAEMAPRNFD